MSHVTVTIGSKILEDREFESDLAAQKFVDDTVKGLSTIGYVCSCTGSTFVLVKCTNRSHEPLIMKILLDAI